MISLAKLLGEKFLYSSVHLWVLFSNFYILSLFKMKTTNSVRVCVCQGVCVCIYVWSCFVFAFKFFNFEITSSLERLQEQHKNILPCSIQIHQLVKICYFCILFSLSTYALFVFLRYLSGRHHIFCL